MCNDPTKDFCEQNIDISMSPPTKEPERQFYFLLRAKKYITALTQKLGRAPIAVINTFGCQMNARDSEKLLGILVELGYVEGMEEEKADFIIFNTCTVRENANLRVYGRLGQIKNLKKKRPHLKIALCGCMMQEPTVVDKIQKSYRFVDLIFGTHNIYKFAELIYDHFSSEDQIIDLLEDTNLIVEDLPTERKFPFKSGVNIMFGCNNFCSYCIVPYVRGRERSRKPEDIIQEIKRLVQSGVIEIMLLGQNVNSYGKTLDSPMTFAELLLEIEQIEGLERIRFMTSHPKDLSPSLIEVMARSKKIARHLHLPMQSGSSHILKEMNRGYTKEEFLDLAKRIRNAIPDISLTTDIIVGFPGETEADFMETLSVVEQVGFDNAFTFIYSKRTGTKAASLEQTATKEEIKKRFDQLLEVVTKASSNACKAIEGSTQQVLVEEINQKDTQLVTGRMSNNVLVHFEGSPDLIGQIVSVALTECKGFYYLGKQL